MATIRLVRDVGLPAAEAWERITRWEDHAAYVPLTRIHLTDRGFVARSGVGPLAVNDAMDVVESRPPHWCRLEKRGRVVLGWAEISVEAQANGSRVTWVEDIRIRWVPRWFDPVLAAAARLMFGRTMDGLLAADAQ